MGQDDLLDILKPARVFNSDHGISGLLLYKDHSFIQLLEGAAEQVETLYQRIANDKRHYRIKTLVHEMTEERLFGEWSMGFQNLDNFVPSKDLVGYSEFMAADFDVSDIIKSADKSLELLLYFRSHS